MRASEQKATEIPLDLCVPPPSGKSRFSRTSPFMAFKISNPKTIASPYSCRIDSINRPRTAPTTAKMQTNTPKPSTVTHSAPRNRHGKP